MEGKARFHARVWSKLVEHERAHRLLAPGDRVLAAVSGGPDSVCLADYLVRLRERLRLDVRLVHFDHGLRADAGPKDARFVERLGRRLGVPVVVERLPVRELAARERRGLEDAGRALRYRALLRLAKRWKTLKVATGHQLDDQAETVLLHLLRGTRPEGLMGIPVHRPLGPGVQVIRPLLALTRQDVAEYLRYRDLPWREDPSNRSRKFLRNWVRLDLLPLLEERAPGIKGRLAAIAEGLRGALRSPSRPEAARWAPGRSKARRRRARPAA